MSEEKKILPEEEDPTLKERIAFDRVQRWISLEDTRILLQESLSEVMKEQRELEKDPTVAATRGAIKASRKIAGPPKKIEASVPEKPKGSARERLKRRLANTRPGDFDLTEERKKKEGMRSKPPGEE